MRETTGSLAFHLAQLRHAYAHLSTGKVNMQKELADGLIAPAIRYLEERHGEQE